MSVLDLMKEMGTKIIKTMDKYAEAKPTETLKKWEYVTEIVKHFDDFKQAKTLLKLMDILKEDKK